MRRFSHQSRRVLAALAAEPSLWRHGYDLSIETGLKSGSLYPILIRLSDRGLLESRWDDNAGQRGPRRHLYRLTALGAEMASEPPAPPVLNQLREAPL